MISLPVNKYDPSGWTNYHQQIYRPIHLVLFGDRLPTLGYPLDERRRSRTAVIVPRLSDELRDGY